MVSGGTLVFHQQDAQLSGSLDPPLQKVRNDLERPDCIGVVQGVMAPRLDERIRAGGATMARKYWVYGIDAESQQPREPLFLEVETIQEAVSRAAGEGMEVTGIEATSASSPEATAGKPSAKPPRQYEFDEAQNRTMSSLGFYLWVLAVVLWCAAALTVAGGMWLVAAGGGATGNRLWQALLAVMEAALAVTVGVLYYRASGSFRQIVDTQGSDITHLMDALEKLKNVYAIFVVLIGIALLLACMAVAWTIPLSGGW
jgi:hypothetical protein